MRAFIAIDLPDQIHRVLARHQDIFRGVGRDARWTRPDGIHLTLKFLGEISDRKGQEVIGALRNLGGFPEFTVEIRDFGFFPDARRPRVFWAGVSASAELGELAARVEDALEKVGFEREQRPYKPHLTLARFKVPRPQPALQEAVEKQANKSVGEFTVAEFFLFESRLSPQGAEYRKVARFPA